MFVKVAPNSLSIPISTFIHSYTSKVKEKLSVQVCKALTNEQIQVVLTSKFVTMATSKEAKQTLFFNLLRLITSKLVGEFYLCLSNKHNKQVCQILKKNLYIGFRDTLFLHKFKVALNPTQRLFKEVVEMSFLPNEQKYIESRNFHCVVYKLLSSNGPKQPIFDLFLRCHGN